MIMRNDRYSAKQYGDDDEAAAAEVAIWRAAPENQKHYLDGPGHDSSEAETQYRYGYFCAVSAISEAPETLAKKLIAARKIRMTAKDDAAIGKHFPIFRAGHEVKAALTRGWHLGLIDCADIVCSASNTTDVVETIHAWLPLLKTWSDGDCTVLAAAPVPPTLSGDR